MSSPARGLWFLCFFVSGFCSLVYQVVWTRMAFASFGIITPVLSVVLSVFMLGLAVGAWLGGRFVGGWTARTKLSALLFYAAAELLIGVGAFAVPRLFAGGEHWLLTLGQTDSLAYLFLSALVLAVSLLPWCVCMGATFPLMMAFLQERERNSSDSFSYLYLANVMGAMSGTLVTALVLVELLGFRHTLAVAAAGNFAVALVCGWRGRKLERIAPVAASVATGEKVHAPATPASRASVKWLLFTTGFVAMAMEVVWTRAFTPVMKTQVYSFALVIFTYLGATFLGSAWYRRDRRRHSVRSTSGVLALLCGAAFLPILANDHRLVELNWDWQGNPRSVALLLASIVPFCAGLGYLTPRLVDDYAGGGPERGGQVYAINVLGCILGPLAAGYVLLPLVSERHALILLGLPLVVFLLRDRQFRTAGSRTAQWVAGLAVGAVLAGSLFITASYDDYVLVNKENAVVRRDYAGSVISCGSGAEKQLYLNGIGTTTLTPITKFMVHLPLALHGRPPESALIICFGMGTSHRAGLSWGIPTTSVELVPSVKAAFGFYHADAAAVLANPQGRIVIDDGRRYLKRSREQFDVIVVDPPPPPEAAGSSLLYSDEFYGLVKERLKPDGILQVWLPGGVDMPTVLATLRSVRDAFPHVRAFGSVEGWGVHLLCSREPIPRRSAAELGARLPERARQDLLEWTGSGDAVGYLQQVVANEMGVDGSLDSNPKLRISDDRPYNEYFLLRRWKWISP
jgi:spermidine synthase